MFLVADDLEVMDLAVAGGDAGLFEHGANAVDAITPAAAAAPASTWKVAPIAASRHA
jgi:hypothetical protein